MQVKAIYEDGVLNFSEPLRFKHRKFEVLVSIPEDDELELEQDMAIGCVQFCTYG
jgi:predicted DNA-binding antitoxin AbrB/MazE fold protein